MDFTVLEAAFKLPLLTATQERELAERYRRGDQQAKERLVEHNVRLIMKVARQHLGKGVDEEDLFQAGVEGCLRAIEKFEPERGFRFTTYASRWIGQACQRVIEREGKQIRTPNYINDFRKAFEERTAYREHVSAKEVEDIAADIAREKSTDANVISVRRVISALTIPTVVTTIESASNADETGHGFKQFVADGERPEDLPHLLWTEGTNCEGFRELVEEVLISVLTEQECTVIKLRFGWDSDALSRNMTGEVMGIKDTHDHSPSHQVQNIERRALDKLRDALAQFGPEGELRG